MVNVSLVIKSKKLREAVVSNFNSEHVKCTEREQWQEHSDVLFNNKSDLIIIDFNAIKNETLDVFVTINTLCENNGMGFVLLVKSKSDGLHELQRKLSCLQEVVETQGGRKDFDRAIRRIVAEVVENQRLKHANADKSKKEIDIFLESSGNINDTSVFDLLFSILVLKKTGALTLVNGERKSVFSFRGGAFVSTEKSGDGLELIDTMAWKTGTYTFEEQESVVGQSRPIEGLLASGVRESLTNLTVMRALMTEMHLYPSLTSRFEDSRKLRECMPELDKLSDFFDRGLSWKEILEEKGEAFFKVAYFAVKTFLVDSSQKPKTLISVTWSQKTRDALESVERKKIEKTTAFKTAQNPDDVEKELRVTLREMEYQSAYEIFELWEGCGKNMVSDRFYELVKTRHPDIYGNVSVSVKGYAQKIFINVKNAHAELLGLEKFDEAQVADEPIVLPVSEAKVSAEEISEAKTPSVKPEKKKSAMDVKTKMGQLSAMRKKRSRRRSLDATPQVEVAATPVVQSETERILSEVSGGSTNSDDSGEASEPAVEDRETRLEKLNKRARKKNPNSIPEALEIFSEGYKLYRQNNIKLAHEKFTVAKELDGRALHLAFFGYTLFLNDSEKADEAETLIRSAIEMNDKQTQPDALFFMAKILKHRGDEKNAHSFFEKAFALNPTNREAEREIRLSLMRNGRKNTESNDFIKNLFKK